MIPSELLYLHCEEHPSGEDNLIYWLYNNQHLTNILRYLWILLMNTRKNNRFHIIIIPSELREEVLLCMIKLIICCGSKLISICFNEILIHPSTTTLLSMNTTSMYNLFANEEKRNNWITQLLSYALQGDWKKFKTFMKFLWRT